MGAETDQDRRAAFERLFDTHYWAVRAYVLRRAPSSSVEDVVADTFLVAWRRLDSLGEDPLPWLLGVARRVLANQHRAQRRHGALTARLGTLLPGPAPDWDPPAAMSDELAAAMVRLSPHEREALLLVAWEGLEPARGGPGRRVQRGGVSRPAAPRAASRRRRSRRHPPRTSLVDRRRGAMTTDDPVITELTEANPVSGAASPDPRDRAAAERIMRRILAETPPRPPRRKAGILVPAVSVAVVLAVAAVALRTGGGSSHSSPSSGRGLTITLAAQPTAQTPQITSSAMNRELELVRQRVGSVLRHSRVTRTRGNSLVIKAPQATAAQRARIIPLITQPAQLYFYDWEANVVARNGRTAAEDITAHDPSVLTLSQGGATAAPGTPGAGSMSLYDAVMLAARQPSRTASRSTARVGPEYYMFGAPGSAACAAAAAAAHTAPVAGTHCLLAGPVDLPGPGSRQRATGALAAQLPAGVTPSSGHVLVVPQGTRVLQAVAPDGVSFPSPTAQFFVLRDDAALTGGDVVGPRVSADASGQPAVSFRFTRAGERAFQAATRNVARRGTEVSRLGESLDQHFAIVLDSRLLTVPSIDFSQYPDGIRTDRADIAGGFSRQSAADLATQLRFGALPLALRVVP